MLAPLSQIFQPPALREIMAFKKSRLWCSIRAAAAAAKSLQSCPTLCNPTDGSSTGSSVPGILQARILEWVSISFSSAWKWKVKVKLLNRVRLLATPWTIAYQAPPSMGFSGQEYWSGVPLSSLLQQSGLTKIDNLLKATSSPPMCLSMYYSPCPADHCRYLLGKPALIFQDWPQRSSHQSINFLVPWPDSD